VQTTQNTRNLKVHSKMRVSLKYEHDLITLTMPTGLGTSNFLGIPVTRASVKSHYVFRLFRCNTSTK